MSDSSVRSESLSVISASSRISGERLSIAQKSVVGLDRKEEWDEESFYSGSFIDSPFLSYIWTEFCHNILKQYRKLDNGQVLLIPYFGLFFKPFNKNCEFPIFHFNNSWSNSFPQYQTYLPEKPILEVSMDFHEMHRRMLPQMRRFDLELTTNQLRLVLKDVFLQFSHTLRSFRSRFVRLVFRKFCKMVFEKKKFHIHYFPQIKEEDFLPEVKMSKNQEKMIKIREIGHHTNRKRETPLHEDRILKKRKSLQLPKSYSASIRSCFEDGDPLKKKLGLIRSNSQLEECQTQINELERIRKLRYRESLLQQIRVFREKRNEEKQSLLESERKMVKKWNIGRMKSMNRFTREEAMIKNRIRSTLKNQIDQKRHSLKKFGVEKRKIDLTDLKTVEIGFKKEFKIWKKMKEQKNRRNQEYNIWKKRKRKTRKSVSSCDSKKLHKSWLKIKRKSKCLSIKDWKLDFGGRK